MFGNFPFKKNKGEKRETEIEELYRKHKSRLFKIAMGYLHNRGSAEDAVHCVFSQILEDKTKIFEIPPNKQTAYLNVLIRNISVGMFKGSLAEIATDPEELEEFPPKDDDIDLEDAVISEISRQELISFIHTLPQGMRDAMVLKYLIGLSNGEAARKLNITENAFRQRLFAARKAVKKFVDDSEKNGGSHE